MKTVPSSAFPLFWVSVFLLGALSARAQSAVLENYIQQGLAQNTALRRQQLNVQAQTAQLQQAQSLFSPTLTLNATYTVAAGGRKIDLPIGDLLNGVYSTLNQLTQTNAFPQVENVKEQFLPNNFQETKVKFAYPFFNTDIRYNRAIQECLVKAEEARAAAGAQELRYQITGAYLQYLQALEAEKIWQNSRTVLTELKRFNESLVKNNVATRDIVATADYELSKADQAIFKIQGAQSVAQAYFNVLLNNDLQASIEVDTNLLRQSVPVYNLAQMQTAALQNRRELNALEAGREASVNAVKLQQANRKLPDAYLGGELGFQGYGYRYLANDQAYVLAQVGVQYDLFNGGLTKHKIEQAQLESQKISTQLQEVQQQIQLQVTQAYYELETARKTWISAKDGLTAAESAFNITQNKYKNQQALPLEFLDAQNRVSNARLQVLLSWTDVLIREAALKKAAGL